ncbi:hypothetical protein J4E91_009880 [Alternaria rosae]|nr:hypothetical protein J4E91_009880 [Alternaria rosae]
MTQRTKDQRGKQCQSYGAYVFEDDGAFEASLDNKPIFTSAFLEKAAEQVEIVRTGEPDPNKQFICLPNVRDDGYRKLRIPPHASPAVSLAFHGVFNSASDEGTLPAYHIGTYSHSSKYDFSDTRVLKPNDTQNTPQQALANRPNREQYKEIPKFLETSLSRSRFWASVREQLDTLTVRVDNIVCVALGTLHRTEVEGREESDRSASQHVLACAISTYLSQRSRPIV